MEYLITFIYYFFLMIVLGIVAVGIIISAQKSFWVGVISFSLFLLSFIAQGIFIFILPTFGVFLRIIQTIAFITLIIGLLKASVQEAKNFGGQSCNLYIISRSCRRNHNISTKVLLGSYYIF